jgi:hypothetical protein
VSTTQTDRVLADRYRLGELLGRGGMADVYEAVDTRLGRPVAVKMLRPAMAARPDVRRRFEDEAKAAARLSHPNVVAVFDTGEDDGTPWIVMERLSGETLAHRMAEADGPLPTDWVLRMAGDVLLALRAAHAAGIVHRDVKPGNILFSDEGCAKVADFGIAKSVEAVGDATTAGILLGTPRYLSPERVEGRPSTMSSDLYAMGVILYETLSGRQAFEGDTPVATAYNVQHTTPEPLAVLRPDLPVALTALVDRAMQRDPSARFASASEMAAAVEAARTIDLTDAPGAGDVGADPTVAIAGAGWAAGSPDPTAIAGAATIAGVVAPASSPSPLAAGSVAAGRSRRRLELYWPVLAVAAVIVLLLIALAMAGGSKKGSGANGGAAGGGQAAALTTDMRNVADRVDDPGHDGPAGPQAASGLRAIADKLDAGKDAGSDATALAQQVNGWHQQRQLFDTATGITLDVLGRVPGVDMNAAAAASPSTTAAPLVQVRVGKGHKKKDD